MRTSRVAAAVIAVWVCVACSKGSEQPVPAKVTAPGPVATPEPPKTGAGTLTDAERQEAKDLFATRCTPCHGADGKGDGPASAALTPPPRNFHDPAWQTQVSDEHIEKIIQHGGEAVGKSISMPPNPDLVDKPVVKALRQHIRDMR